MSLKLARFYKLLLDKESVAYSSLNKESVKESERLQLMGGIRIQPSGAGKRVIVTDFQLVQSESSRIFPEGPDAALKNTGSKHGNVATMGDSKGHTVTYPVLQFRINQPLLFNIGGNPFLSDSVDWNTIFSISILESKINNVHINGPMVMVENKESFMFSTQHFPDSVCSLYYNGRVKRSWFPWILSNVASVIFCPDYDPVGIDEYLSAKEILGEKVSLFVPENIEELFSRYSKKSIYTDNISLIDRLMKSAFLDEKSLRVLKLIIENQAGVEQEIVFPKL